MKPSRSYAEELCFFLFTPSLPSRVPGPMSDVAYGG